jgi:hypothetical protein
LDGNGQRALLAVAGNIAFGSCIQDRKRIDRPQQLLELSNLDWACALQSQPIPTLLE